MRDVLFTSSLPQGLDRHQPPRMLHSPAVRGFVREQAARFVSTEWPNPPALAEGGWELAYQCLHAGAALPPDHQLCSQPHQGYGGHYSPSLSQPQPER